MVVVTADKLGEIAPINSLYKTIVVELDATTDDGDTVAVNMADYGCSKLIAVQGFIHSTEYSVIASENPTTSVTGTTATLTVGGATDNKRRSYILIMR